jgi:hypothetical protein
MPTNQEALQAMDAFFKRHNIGKADPGVISVADSNFGNLLPRQTVEALIDLTRKQNQWLTQINTVIRSQAAGTIPILNINQPVSRYVGENEGTKVPHKPETRRANYACKKIKSEWYVTREEVREALAAGIDQFEQKMRELFATAIGNDIANLVTNGDTSLSTNTPEELLLRAANGFRKQMETGGNTHDAAGKIWDKEIFPAMLDNLPSKYLSDPNLHWLYNDYVEITFIKTLTDRATVLGDQSLTQAVNIRPWGKPRLIIPQLQANYGPAPLAPTSAAGTTAITFVLTTLVTAGYVASAAAGVGRKFIVTCMTTGVSEVCTGVLNTTLNIVTLGTLGQTVVSTTASDYTVTLYDETEQYLINPKAITLIQCTDMFATREYNKDYDRFETTLYHELDVLVPTPEVGVKFKRIQRIPVGAW